MWSCDNPVKNYDCTIVMYTSAELQTMSQGDRVQSNLYLIQ